MPEVTTKMLCITCPVGCALDVRHDGDTIIGIAGNACKQGLEYVRTELSDPRRMIATTVRVVDGVHRLLPVYTESPFPKGLIFELLAELRGVAVPAPVTMGQVIVRNALGTGVNVLASRDLPRG